MLFFLVSLTLLYWSTDNTANVNANATFILVTMSFTISVQMKLVALNDFSNAFSLVYINPNIHINVNKFCDVNVCLASKIIFKIIWFIIFAYIKSISVSNPCFLQCWL